MTFSRCNRRRTDGTRILPALRGGFTLVELLVVIAIIGVLIALLVPAVFRYLEKINQTTTANEISQFDQAIQNFKSTYSVGHVPSRIKLCEKFGSYLVSENGTPDVPANQLDRDSVDYLTRVFNRILDKDPTTGVVLWQSRGIDWNNNGNYGDAPVILEGDQSLVFFLGGPPGLAGFATDPRDPVKGLASGGSQQTTGRKGPFYAFMSNRLVIRPPAPFSGGGAGYPSYIDPHGVGSALGKPFVYFSNYDLGNSGYNKYGTTYGVSDCAGLGVQPYFDNTTVNNPPKYYNPKSYQILSAGTNQLFAPGGGWTSANAGLIGPNGADDQSNFNNGSLMGTGN